jgi:hypothetical protein
MRRILANILSILGIALSVALILSYKWLDKKGVDEFVTIPSLFHYIPAVALLCGVVAWLVSKTLLLKFGEKLLSKICMAAAIVCFGYGIVVFHL